MGIDEISVDDVMKSKATLKSMHDRIASWSPDVIPDLNEALDDERREILKNFDSLNSLVERYQSARLLPQVMLPKGSMTPQLAFRPATLYGFMIFELAIMATGGHRLHTCEYCSRAFATGTGTNRRSKSKYCDTTCRTAAHRARNKALTA
jgi:hypothetical protein